jgi:hypothetical protein
MRNLFLLFFTDIVPVRSYVLVAEDLANLFQSPAFGLWK